jgi:hypothetical protein
LPFAGSTKWASDFSLDFNFTVLIMKCHVWIHFPSCCVCSVIILWQDAGTENSWAGLCDVCRVHHVVIDEKVRYYCIAGPDIPLDMWEILLHILVCSCYVVSTQ